MDREAIARARRREQALENLEFEQERETALAGQLGDILIEAHGWRSERELLSQLEPEEAQALRDAAFEALPPDEDQRAELEEEIVRLEGVLAECRLRQRAYEGYIEALGE
ncbi:MAG TPA: hypothetical protein VGJ25_13625 [Gaiellaceae bacterium]